MRVRVLDIAQLQRVSSYKMVMSFGKPMVSWSMTGGLLEVSCVEYCQRERGHPDESRHIES